MHIIIGTISILANVDLKAENHSADILVLQVYHIHLKLNFSRRYKLTITT